MAQFPVTTSHAVTDSWKSGLVLELKQNIVEHHEASIRRCFAGADVDGCLQFPAIIGRRGQEPRFRKLPDVDIIFRIGCEHQPSLSRRNGKEIVGRTVGQLTEYSRSHSFEANAPQVRTVVDAELSVKIRIIMIADEENRLPVRRPARGRVDGGSGSEPGAGAGFQIDHPNPRFAGGTNVGEMASVR